MLVEMMVAVMAEEKVERQVLKLVDQMVSKTVVEKVVCVVGMMVVALVALMVGQKVDEMDYDREILLVDWMVANMAAQLVLHWGRLMAG